MPSLFSRSDREQSEMLEKYCFSNDEIERKLCQLAENDLSQRILVPLFTRVFSGSVQFTGQPQEKGRDLLINRIDELGEVQYIAVQVKKLRVTSNTQHSGSLQQLLNQLSQARSEPVVDITRGLRIRIDRLFFVTPYTIPQTVLDSHQSAFKEAMEKYNCRVIDGAKLAKLIKDHLPEALNSLFEPEYILSSYVFKKLKNAPLMKALDAQAPRNISEIYCDISFSIGRTSQSTRSVSKVSSEKIQERFRVMIEKAEFYRKLNDKFREKSGEDLFDLTDFSRCRLTEAEEIEVRQKKFGVENEIETIRHQIADEARKLGLKQLTIDALRAAATKRGFDYRSALQDIVRSHRDFTPALRKKYAEKTARLRAKLPGLLTELGTLSEDLGHTHAELVLFPNRLVAFVNREIEELANLVPANAQECRVQMERMSEVQEIFALTRIFPRTFVRLSAEDNPTYSRLNIPLHTVFETGLNVTVLGDAGSGKTTSLQMFAHHLLATKEDRFVVYIPLIELGGYSDGDSIDLLKCLTLYLRSAGIQVNIDDVRVQLHRGDAVLLLDSIDEGVAVYPDLIDRILAFAQAFPKCQFITSSRNSVIRDLVAPFHQVTLLPFTQEQLAKFFDKWFKGDDRASGAIEVHLKRHRKLHSVVTNPLSATILCVLFSNGVPLPQCEASLYGTRLELLAGRFDKEKGLCRLNNPADTLVEAAKIVGFEMHTARLRAAPTSAIEEFLAANRIGSNKEERESLVQDMLTSEILVHASSTNLSFGHLRFQEFLASEELKNRRSFATDKLLRDPWWNGPLLIYVQTAREVEWLFNHAVANDYVEEVNSLLQVIADMRPKREKELLLRRIRIALADKSTRDTIGEAEDHYDVHE